MALYFISNANTKVDLLLITDTPDLIFDGSGKKQ
jgi:hypothetical protein